MIASIRTFYLKTATTLTYMLQSTEYDSGAYLKWFWQTQDFSKVMRRRTLDRTKRARLILSALRLGILLQLVVGAGLVIYGIYSKNTLPLGLFAAAVLLSYPIVWAHLIVVPLFAAQYLVIKPERARLGEEARRIFAAYPGVKIVIVGSYGKTTMKELLLTVLSESKQVAATPGNENVISSHARFARRLTGKEDVVIIEFGEGAPGDVAAMARLANPDYALVTGLAPAHLDKYKTLEAAGKDIMSIAEFVQPEHIYANGDSSELMPLLHDKFNIYSAGGLGTWKVGNVSVSLDGTDFTLSHGKRQLKLHSGLLGRHQIGPLVAVAAIGMELEVADTEIERGIAETRPFEHRMQPYQLQGAWVIDDTYNGNLEGIRAGTALLKELPAKRKWYVTPGLVDQGAETGKIHREVGSLIAVANPDIVVLMQNSVTADIQSGLEKSGYKGEVRVEKDPLNFYQHLDQFVGAGDLVLMQNDWTDNYA